MEELEKRVEALEKEVKELKENFDPKKLAKLVFENQKELTS